MERRLLFQEFTRTELRDLAPHALAVFPVGATEQHGPHLPVGTDCYAVEQIARDAAARVAGAIPVVVAPTLPFGSSHHHLPFGGTMSLGTEIYYRVMHDLVESLITDGFRRIFIVNGHGGNDEVVQLVARDLARTHPAHIAAASYWDIAWDALVAEDAHLSGGLPGHAGAFEASLVLALHPDLVREPRPHRDDVTVSDPRGHRAYRAEFHGRWEEVDGYSDSPDRATSERGRTYLAAVVHAVGDAFTAFYDAAGDATS